jgi:hypothetical protein
MNPVDFLIINVTIMAIERDYYYLNKLEELWLSDKIRFSFYIEQRKHIEESLEQLCKDNPFNELKEELNLI